MRMKSPTYNRSELAKKYGVSVQTVDAWTRRGCPHRQRKSGRRDYVFELWEVAKWRAAQLAEDSQRRGYSNGGHRPIPDAAREWLDNIAIGQELLLPWLVDKCDTPPHVAELIVTFDEYRRESGLDGEELLLRVVYGLPTLPPAPGDKKKRGRISLPHARAWLLLISGFVESIGGDGMAKRIACEAHRLRGYPVGDSDDQAGDELEEENGVEASP
jgi:hypothetical protein